MALNYGPGHITIGSVKLKGMINVRQITGTFDLTQEGGGVMNKAVTSYYHEITLQHDGRLPASALPVLFPHVGTATAIGQPIYDNTGIVLNMASGQKRTYHNCKLRTMTPLKLSSKAKATGTMTFIAIPKSTVAVSDAASLYTDASEAYSEVSDYDPADILTGLWTAAWGDTAPWDEFYFKDGADLSFTLDLVEELNDRHGICNALMRGCQVQVTGIPDAANSGPSYSDVLAALNHQGAGAAIGKHLRGANDLVLTGPGNVVITISKPAVISGTEMYGVNRREGVMTFASSRSVTSGVLGAVMTITRESEE